MCLYKPIPEVFSLFKSTRDFKGTTEGEGRRNGYALNVSQQIGLTLPATSASLFSCQCIAGRAQRDPHFPCHLLAVRPWAGYLIFLKLTLLICKSDS